MFLSFYSLLKKCISLNYSYIKNSGRIKLVYIIGQHEDKLCKNL